MLLYRVSSLEKSLRVCPLSLHSLLLLSSLSSLPCFFFFLACTTLDRYTVIPASLVNMYWYVFAKSTPLKVVVFLVRYRVECDAERFSFPRCVCLHFLHATAVDACSVRRIGRVQVKVFLYEMASIGMRAKTAQRYVEAVSLQYKLQPAARNRLSVRLDFALMQSYSYAGSTLFFFFFFPSTAF